ncbi:MAG TPA: hypothetical protein VFT04_09160 [Gemmatimonadales bacterium]|nr:hypothetical protein [Gemmatimonadales bacterium]
MCTLSWLPRPGGHVFWHGRDERTTRLPGEAPSLVRRGTLDAIAPRDGDAGGTWVGVNELGLTLGLANLYPPEGVAASGGIPAKGLVTRGRIIDDLLSARTAEEARSLLEAMDPHVFAPFTLAVLEPGRSPGLHRWNGVDLETTTVAAPGLLLTSSGAGRQVEQIRRVEYARLAPGSPPRAEDIEALHRSHLEALGADSFCMHHEEAETASLTRVEVGSGGIRMTYTPGPPCRTPSLESLALDHVDSASPRSTYH